MKSQRRSPTPPDAEIDTRDRIIKAALKAFAEHGFDAATLREITQLAGANLAAVNYYFRSKDELLKSALEYCLAPLNAKRLALLNALQDRPTGRPAKLEDYIEALVRPMVELDLNKDGGREPIRLLLHARAIPRPFTNRIMAEQFDEVHSRFEQAFRAALPHLPAPEFALRYEFARGAIIQIVADLDPTARRRPGLKFAHSADENERIIRNLVHFIASGFRAPSLG